MNQTRDQNSNGDPDDVRTPESTEQVMSSFLPPPTLMEDDTEILIDVNRSDHPPIPGNCIQRRPQLFLD